MQLVLLNAVLVGVATGLAPVPAREVPAGPPPTFVVVSAVSPAKGTMKCTVTRAVPVTTEQTYQVVVNGRTQTRTRTVTRYVRQLSTRILSLEHYMFQDGRGKKLSRKEGLRRASLGTAVLLARSPEGVDRTYLKALSEKALILVPHPPKRAPK